MKKLVISLLRRPDRKVEFQKNGLSNFEYIEAVDGDQELFRDIKARPYWIDPFQHRKLQHNEVACMQSHMKAWQRCVDLNEPVIVLEDDAVVKYNWNEELFKSFLHEWDFIYLQRNENEPELTESVSELLEIPYYPYNMTAYVLHPHAAKLLLKYADPHDAIPVDEYLPEIIKKGIMSIAALKEDACDQLPRSYSDIENGRVFTGSKTWAVTCGTDPKRMSNINTSARHHGIDLINIGKGIEWKGTDMTGMGGGMKINLMREFLATKHPDDIVLFTDGYDVFYADNLDTIVERFLQMNKRVIFSGESICWPDEGVANQFPEAPTRFKYLNSGTYIGYAGDLFDIMNHADIEDHEDDQLYMHNLFFEGIYDIGIDYECYIFQTHFEGTTKLGSQLHNPETQCCPCIYHGNGGQDALQKYLDLYQQFYPQTLDLFIPHHKVEILHRDMLLVDFMTQEQCDRLIAIADKHGGWGSLEYDKFPAQEIRMKELGLWEELQESWDKYIVPTVEQYWKPLQMYGLRDGFVMRYAMDTQVSLNLHHDASLVTGSVKLNDDYEGAELIYPRQGISNLDIPIGKMILFPSQVTHGHECLPLKSGVKYSLTIWSSRYVGDNI